MNVYEEAIQFAAEKHSGYVRKMFTLPYVIHPLEVSVIVSAMTDDLNTMAAAVLHDTVEDAGVSIEEIVERFGETVKKLVAAETEDKRRNRPPEETWEIRKKEVLEEIRNSDNIEAKKICLADKLSNMRSIKRLYDEKGASLWNGFHQKDPAVQEQYYRAVLDSLSELSNTDAYRELEETVKYIFR